MNLPSISKELLAQAHHAVNELAWRRTDVASVIDALAHNGYLLLGGEVWIVSDTGHITVTIPQTSSPIPGIYAWSYAPSEPNVQDHWRDECDTSAAYNKQIILTLSPEQDTVEQFQQHIWYNLCYVDQDEYKTIGHGL